MCECGCTSFDPVAKIKAPKGKWYVIQIYQGCKYCDVEAGIILYEMTARELKEDWVENDLPELQVYNQGRGLLIPVVGVDAMVKEIKDVLSINLEELNEEAFRSAVWNTRSNWGKHIRNAK